MHFNVFSSGAITTRNGHRLLETSRARFSGFYAWREDAVRALSAPRGGMLRLSERACVGRRIAYGSLVLAPPSVSFLSPGETSDVAASPQYVTTTPRFSKGWKGQEVDGRDGVSPSAVEQLGADHDSCIAKCKPQNPFSEYWWLEAGTHSRTEV